MDVRNAVDTVDYDDIAEGVRRFCAERLYELEKSLRPLVDGTFGEVLPGHLSSYVSTIRQLGRLYQVESPPRYLQDLLSRQKVEQMLARMAEQHAVEVAREVALAEARVRAELSNGQKVSIQQAKELVSSRLLKLESRIS